MKDRIRTVIYHCAPKSDQLFEKQKTDLKAYTHEKGLTVIEQFFDEIAVYKLEDRLQLKELLTAARRKEFECVMIWKFTCFAASIPHLLQLLEEFIQLDIRLISIQDGIDTKGELGEEFMEALKLIVKIKTALIKERTQEGLRTARSKGKILGRPSVPPSPEVIRIVEELAATTNLPIYKIREETGKRLTYQLTRDIIRRVRSVEST